jgi:hypothetical protein
MSKPRRQADCHTSEKHMAKGLCKKCYAGLIYKTNRISILENSRARRPHNKEKIAIKDKAYREKNKRKIKLVHIKWRYGITPEAYNSLLEAQKGLCAVCRTCPAKAVDHDHKTGQIRGILCATCNTGLGVFKENEGNLLSAIEYLRTWKDRQIL